MKPEKKSKRKTVLTTIFHVAVLFITAQLSSFLSNRFDAVGLKAAIIFLICAFVVYCVATLIVNHLIPAIRKKLARTEGMAQDSDRENFTMKKEFIQVDNKIHKITGVTELFGYVKSVYHSRYTTLLIEMGKEKIKLFSIPIGQEQGFADSSLYPLYNLVLSRTDDLEPVDVWGQETEYWYKKSGKK